ncbi:MAG: DUF1573 domain-containing protein [Parcubacteria group bacterium]|nr:DUF1573 domain-containing protein [Parcubacteria group bacterium]
MKPKIIILIVLVCLVIIGLMFWGYEKGGSTSASVQGVFSTNKESVLSAPVTFYDFGAISMKNGDVTKDFTITNSTSTDIAIRGIETSCMCTDALLVLSDGSTKGPFGMSGMGRTTTNEIIKAGESGIVRVVYDPNAHGPAGVGSINRFVMVTDAQGGMLKFEIKAVVTP